MFEVKGNITIDIPALDHLVDYLKGKEPVKVFMTESMVDSAAKEAVEAEKAEKKAEPKKTAKAEKKVVEMPKAAEAPAPEPEPVKEETTEPEPEVQEKKYAPDEVAAMAMRLRDKDKANSAKIKEFFPELGIVSLGDIRKNEAACQKLAKILVDMGGAD